MRALLFITLLSCCSGVAAADQIFISNEKPPQLIELFTSEGCSSCPPADHWLSALKQQEGLWTDFVPLAFHVDYWDWLGWEDKFASAEYSNRQRNYARQQQADSVYTPGFMVAGEEWRGFFRRGGLPANEQQSAPKLSLAITGQAFDLAFAGDPKLVGKAHVAILGMDLVTPVKRGENAGRTLTHDFVVLDWQTFKRGETWSGEIAIDESLGAKNLAIAAWVEHPTKKTPLQVVGGYLDKQ